MSSFIKHNRGFIGNALKNVAPLAAFTPLGVLGAGAIGALGRGIQPGANLGDILKQGATDAAIGGGAHAGVGALRAAFAPGSSAAGTVAASATPGAASGANAVNIGGITAPAPAAATLPSVGTPMSALDRIGSAARGVGSFAKNNPTAAAMGLQGVGQIGTMGAENALSRAQADAIRTNTAQTQSQMDEEKRRAQLMEPLLRMLMGNQQQYTVAPNPYTRR